MSDNATVEGKMKQLLSLDVNKYTEKKGNLTYLSWANAVAEFIKVYPDFEYGYKSENGLSYFGNEAQGYMVYTWVKAGGITREMWLPVMDNRNKSMMKPTTFNVNTALMRCLTKNLAMFGLGLYIYKGEDLPNLVPTGVKVTDLIEVGFKKGYEAKTIEKSLIRDYGHGMEYISQKEHDEALAKLTALPDKED